VTIDFAPRRDRPYERLTGGLLTTATTQATTVDDLVLETLGAGPCTTYRLVAAVSERAPGVFGGREGLVFPLLFGLRRRGLVVSEWTDAGAERRNVYRLAGAEPGPPLADLPPGRPGARLAEAADRATKRLAFAPRLREEFRADVLAHLSDAAAAHRAAGVADAEAERQAVRALGDPWKIGVDLARTAQGRRTVIFPASAADNLAGVVLYDLRVLLLILGVIVFVRVQVITAYHIPTKSMEPTLHGDPRHGDRILVNKLSGAPKRFDITVFDGFDTDRKNFVKRCTGLPGEKLELHEGDLWIDGSLVRKDGDAYEALLFEVFDADRERDRAKERAGAAGAEAAFRERMQEAWKAEGDGECGMQEDAAAPFAGFRLKAPGPGASLPFERLAWRGVVADTYVDPESGDTFGGANSVCDMRVTASVKPVPGTDAKVVLTLTRGDEGVYEAEICGDGPGVSLVADGQRVAHTDDASVPEGVTTTVSFSQVDRVLRLCVGGRLVLRHDLPAPAEPRRDGPPGSVSASVRRGAAWIDPLRLERDVYWVPEGPAQSFERLGPDQFFMMGDNSSNSQDSRVKGPVHRSRLVGSPLLVVWPPSRIHVPR
jgi:signal peptidase I